MKSRVMLVVFALLLIPAFSASARENARPASPRLVIASLEHSFGSVKPGTPLSYTFTVKNEGDTDLEIKSVIPSCGCTTSQFDKTIAPGKEGKITLEVQKTDGYKGEIVKNAAVTTNDPDHQTFALVLRANFSAE
ncbi:MAG TPA: DUF1573 domain-containing protein [Blastocatellia bacterium]|nr:DUF1573 domain-containing protein [Blastocatellia bacterium]